jgi:hypothetical protein
MEVVNIRDLSKKKQKTGLLEVLDDLRKRIEEGDLEEFVVASMDSDGDVEIHVCVKDLVGGVGLYEMGKHILMQQQSMNFD